MKILKCISDKTLATLWAVLAIYLSYATLTGDWGI